MRLVLLPVLQRAREQVDGDHALLLEAERVEAFSTADQEPPADRATFQTPLGTDGGEDADEEAAEDENGLSKT